MNNPINSGITNMDPQNQQPVTSPLTGSAPFDEKSGFIESNPDIESNFKTEITPEKSIDTEPTLENKVEISQKPIPINSDKPIQQSTPIKESVTSIHVVDTRTGDTVEHNIKTDDKLSQLADEDENNFIEGVDTAHGKPKAVSQ